jgi:hypothetical protein
MKTAKKINVTPAKLAANRANAQKSTGPRTPQGKRQSAANARVTHGLCTDEPKLTEADRVEINEIQAILESTHQSNTHEATELTHHAATTKQRVHHILRLMDQVISEATGPSLLTLDRHLGAAQAAHNRAKKALHANQHQRTQTNQPKTPNPYQRTQTRPPEPPNPHQRTQTTWTSQTPAFCLLTAEFYRLIPVSAVKLGLNAKL